MRLWTKTEVNNKIKLLNKRQELRSVNKLPDYASKRSSSSGVQNTPDF